MHTRVVFMGSAELACAPLKALADDPAFELVGVVTRADRPKGRALQVKPTPVKKLALSRELPVWEPGSLDETAFQQALAELDPDLIVVTAYGKLLPPSVLDRPRRGCVNVHASLLPKFRGAAPIQWAILEGETRTGVTIMKMDPGLDTGGILAQEETPIHPADNAETLHRRLTELGASLLVATLPKYLSGELQPNPQPSEGASHAPKIRKEDAHLDWRLPAARICNAVRAFTPRPGAFTYRGAEDRPERLKIWEAEAVQRSGQPGEVLEAGHSGVVVACGEGAVSLKRLQREGGKPLVARDFLSGHPVAPGEIWR